MNSTVGGRLKGILLTNGISQSKVVALGGKYWEEPGFAKAAVRTGNYEREDAHDAKHRHFGDEDAPQKWPDDITKVQQDHVLEEQRWEGKLWHEIAQSFGLGGGDDVCPPCDVST